MMREFILVLNTGSTSTKLALYQREKVVAEKTVSHSHEELAQYLFVTQQHDMRKRCVLDFLTEQQVQLEQLELIMSRGGSTLPVEGGAYLINDIMFDRLKNHPFVQHAGILGPVIARELANASGICAYVFDSAAVDEMTDVAHISGMKEIRRASLVHTLNTRYTSRLVARQLGRSYETCNIIAAHLGGGITITLHSKGRIVDVVGDEEGSFSPERAGGVSSRMLVDLCFSGNYQSADDVHRIMRGGGGLMSYLGTADVLEVEEKCTDGDKFAQLIYQAMEYQTAKSIASLAPVVNGAVDFIVLTGAIAKSEKFISALKQRISFLAPVHVVPGDHEMEALHQGALEIIRDPSCVKTYVES